MDQVEAAIPTATPTSIPDATSVVVSIFSAKPTNLYENVIEMVENGLAPSDIADIVSAYSVGYNSETNVNPAVPHKAIYPKKSSSDAPYSLTETQLREVIYIPSTFTYGKKPPVTLVPGTSSKGGETYGANYIKLLTGTSYADPVWLNIPGFLLGDAQVNAEYVATPSIIFLQISMAQSKPTPPAQNSQHFHAHPQSSNKNTILTSLSPFAPTVEIQLMFQRQAYIAGPGTKL